MPPELHENRMDELEVEAVLAFAEQVVALTGSTWNPVVAQLTVFEALKDAYA